MNAGIGISAAFFLIIVAACGDPGVTPAPSLLGSPTAEPSLSPSPSSSATGAESQQPTPFAPPSTAPTLPPPPETPTPSPVETPSASPTSTQRPGHLVVDAQLAGPGIGWIETDQALMVTDDDGQTWRDATPTGQGATYGLAALDGQTAFVATDEVGATITTVRIWRTSDGGRTWHGTKLASVPSPDTYADCGCGGHGVLVDIVDALDVFVDVVTVSGTDGESHDVFRSLDGGLTWKSMVLAIEQHGAPADLAIHFLTGDVGTVLFDNRLFVTESGWGQWRETDQTGQVGYSLVTFLDRRHWVISELQNSTGVIEFAESLDGGRTWTTRTRTIGVSPMPTGLARLSFIDATTWVAVISETLDQQLNTQGPAGTWISTDAGKTWRLVGDQPSSKPQNSTFVDRLHAWATTDTGGLATTSDGGATWYEIGP